MIISHDLKIIFLKTRKVAGTSMEIALSKFCGDDDIITPITAADEATRRQLGFRGPQNYVDTSWVNVVNGKKIPYWQTKGTFLNHIPASIVKGMVPPSIWADYLIVSMVRNPFDVLLSAYFWDKAKVGFEKYVQENTRIVRANIEITHIDKKSVVGFYIRYEHLEEDVCALEAKLGKSGIWDQLKNIRAKGNARPKNAGSVAECYSNAPAAKALVHSRCAYEIERFGYTI